MTLSQVTFAFEAGHALLSLDALVPGVVVVVAWSLGFVLVLDHFSVMWSKYLILQITDMSFWQNFRT